MACASSLPNLEVPMKPSVIARHRLGILLCAAAGGCFDPPDPVALTDGSSSGSTGSGGSGPAPTSQDESSTAPSPDVTGDPTTGPDPTAGSDPTVGPGTTDGPEP